MTKHTLTFTLAVWADLMLFAPAAMPRATSTATVSGQVTDQQGAAVGAAAIAGLPEKHWSLTDDDLVRIFETMCRERPWLDRLAVLEGGPTVQIVDQYAEHPGESVTVVAIVPHDSEANDVVVVSAQDGSQLSLYLDQVSAMVHVGTRG